MIKAASVITTALALGVLCQSAWAWPMNFTAQDGSGDEISIKKGWFGNKTKVAKDRFGDGFAEKKSILGTKQTEVNVLGNGIATKKGLFGNREIQAHTILGDNFTTKKHWWGRTTSVNASGIGSLLDSTFKGKMGRNGMPPMLGSSQNHVGANPQGFAPAQGMPGAPADFGNQPPELPGPQSMKPESFPSAPAQPRPSSPSSQSISSDPINSNNDVLQFGQ